MVDEKVYTIGDLDLIQCTIETITLLPQMTVQPFPIILFNSAIADFKRMFPKMSENTRKATYTAMLIFSQSAEIQATISDVLFKKIISFHKFTDKFSISTKRYAEFRDLLLENCSFDELKQMFIFAVTLNLDTFLHALGQQMSKHLQGKSTAELRCLLEVSENSDEDTEAISILKETFPEDFD